MINPIVRLAIVPKQNSSGGFDLNFQGFGKRERVMPKIDKMDTHHVGKGGLGPNIRLAHVPGAQGDNVLLGQRGVKQLEAEIAPALLVSYIYLEPFLKNQHRYAYRDWVMDSGAFSAHASGTEINLRDYIDCCKRLSDKDKTLTEVFALDVIGDWKASLKNTKRMWKQGVEAIPCFHYGEPWTVLKGLCKDYPKVAIGGCVGMRDKDAFAGQCFARVWPHKLHGFGFGSEKSLMLYPWHSVDATNWEMGPCAYGRWNAFGGKLSVRGSQQNLRAEVEWFLDLERRARDRWRKEMLKLEGDGRTVRLASEPNSGGGKRLAEALAPPTLRLAEQQGSDEQVRRSGLSPVVRLAQKQSGRENGKGLEPKKRSKK